MLTAFATRLALASILGSCDNSIIARKVNQLSGIRSNTVHLGLRPTIPGFIIFALPLPIAHHDPIHFQSSPLIRFLF